ncbi:MAG: hypothetical protein WDA00_01775 [Eubacteriales bacterium]
MKEFWGKIKAFFSGLFKKKEAPVSQQAAEAPAAKTTEKAAEETAATEE